MFAATFCFRFAKRAFLVAPFREVYSVYFAVALLTQGLSVGNVEAQVGMSCPRFNMMSVNLAFRSAPDARPAIPLVDLLSPYFQFGRQTSAVTFHRPAIFPGVASSALASASAGTESLSKCFMNRERFVADRTLNWLGRVAARPARFGTESAALAQSPLEVNAADGADALFTSAPFQSGCCRHAHHSPAGSRSRAMVQSISQMSSRSIADERLPSFQASWSWTAALRKAAATCCVGDPGC